MDSMVTIYIFCINPQDFRAIKRGYYPMRTIDEVVTLMSNSKVFSVLDANSGFWEIRLNHDSANFAHSIFIMADTCSIDCHLDCHHPKTYSNALRQRCLKTYVEGIKVIVDDLLVWGEDEKQHESKLLKVLG